jgi:CheY-like chemotaxis protein
MHFTAHFAAEDAALVQSSDRAGLRCLVVDDNANHRGTVAAILTNWGAAVTEADCPTSARDRLAEPTKAFDLVLVDAQMETPDDGLGLAARIDEERLARRVVVMITTDRPSEAAYCREAGLDYLLKPVRRSDLSESIDGGPQRHGRPAIQLAGVEGNDYRAPGDRPVRILLADDSEDNRFLVHAYLKDTGCRIDEVENGALAVENFKHQVYDLVITDVEMPVLDGFAAVREMRCIEKELNRRPIPILALTAHALEKAKERSAEAGCTDHLAKPIRKSTLVEVVRRYAGAARATNRTENAGEAWLKPIVSSYLEKRRADVEKIRTATEARDYTVIRMLGHQMAGTGASYGFGPISDIGFALEASALSEDAARIAAAVDELDRYLRGLPAN